MDCYTPSPALAGLFRSLRIYHGDPDRSAAMDALYRQFLKEDDLAFDIGSHVGDRISSFRRIGARVVAVEPQPLPFRSLRLIHGQDDQVTLVQAACSTERGPLTFLINSANPTVSTASTAFTAAADGAPGWEGQNWDQRVTVTCTSLDALIAQYGRPRFIKIDVEGFEADVLDSLSSPVDALSFEFTTIQRDVAMQCLERLNHLGYRRFNIALGESQQLDFNNAVSHPEVLNTLKSLPQKANSGDIYALHGDG